MKRGKKVYDLLPASEGDVSKMFRKAVRSTFSSQSTNEDQSKIDILDLVASTSSSSTGDAQKSAPHMIIYLLRTKYRWPIN